MLKEIQQKTSANRSESIGHLLSPKPTTDILLYEGLSADYNDIILHRADGKREVVTLRDVEDLGTEKLMYGVSSAGWIVYVHSSLNGVEYVKCFNSTDVITTMNQYKQKFG
jgi:hypothetical protein